MRSFSRRRSRKGQALAEFAIAAPMVMVFAFGVWDVGRWVNYGSVASGAAQAGVHQFQVCAYSSAAASNCAANGNTYDFGGAIYNSDPKDVADWGLEGPTSGPVQMLNCDSTGVGCGDPGGCTFGDVGWPAASNPVMGCFAIGYCTARLSTTPPSCSTPTWCQTLWATPAGNSCAHLAQVAGTLVVRVVVRAPAISPVGFALSSNGAFYIARQYYGSVTF